MENVSQLNLLSFCDRPDVNKWNNNAPYGD